MAAEEAKASGGDLTTLRVGMTCGGCANSVKRILGKIEGISEIDADVETKLVKVKHSGVDPELMVTKLKKWADASGKEVTLLGEGEAA